MPHERLFSRIKIDWRRANIGHCHPRLTRRKFAIRAHTKKHPSRPRDEATIRRPRPNPIIVTPLRGIQAT